MVSFHPKIFDAHVRCVCSKYDNNAPWLDLKCFRLETPQRQNQFAGCEVVG